MCCCASLRLHCTLRRSEPVGPQSVRAAEMPPICESVSSLTDVVRVHLLLVRSNNETASRNMFTLCTPFCTFKAKAPFAKPHPSFDLRWPQRMAHHLGMEPR